MNAFTLTFGGINILPSQVSYRAFDLDADTTLAWPTEVATNTDVVAVIMEVTADTTGRTLTMPPANETSLGNGALIINRGSATFTVADNAGNTITTVAAGIGWQVWTTGNSSAAGTWASLQYGAGTSSANAGALAGYGLKAISATLNQSIPVTGINTDYTAGAPDRSTLLNWTGGAGTITLPDATDVGSDWYVQIHNSGSGAVVADPPGSETIDGATSKTFNPGDSAFIVSDGANFLSIGFGQAPEFAFSYISISLTGETSPYTLSGAELNQISYNFSGVLTANMEIVVPTTVQQYWVRNSTSGAYTLTVKTSAGTGIEVAQGGAAILYCDGTNVVSADTGGIATPISVADGGTGAATADNALVNLGGTPVGRAVFKAADAGTGRLALLAAASGANGDITSLTGLTTALSVPQGGTGAATLTGLVKGNGAGAMTAVTAPSGTVVGTTDTQTLTNKRVDPRVVSAASASTLTPDISAADEYAFTALAANLTINAPTGTPVDGNKMLFRLLDNGVSRTLTWNAIFRAIGVTLPTATTAGKLSYVGAIYNAADTKWDVVAAVTQA